MVEEKQQTQTSMDISDISRHKIRMTSTGTTTAPLDDDTRSVSDRVSSSEHHIRSKHDTISSWYLLCVEPYAALRTFALYLVSLETLCISSMSIALTLYLYLTIEESDNVTGKMDWVLLGFALVTPLSISIRSAWFRRQDALDYITRLQAAMLSLYQAHASWYSDLEHGELLKESDKVFLILTSLCDDLVRFLTLPTVGEMRHHTTHKGKEDAKTNIAVADELFYSITADKATKISVQGSHMSALGMSPSIVSRFRQYELVIIESLHKLRAIKMYRTPQALKCFVNIFVWVLPIFYAPAFAQLSRDMDNVIPGLLFAVVVAVVLSAQLNTMKKLEDPFIIGATLDGIDVNMEFKVLFKNSLISTRATFFPQLTKTRRDSVFTSTTREKTGSIDSKFYPSSFLDHSWPSN